MNYSRTAFFAAGVLILLSIAFPYLAMVFTSPQYPDKSPVVLVYTDRLGGDVQEWQVVGRYIGVKVPPELPESDSKIISVIIAFIALIVAIGAFTSMRWKKIIAVFLLVGGVALAGWAQYRLHEAGHNLDPRAPMRYVVKPFTPPLVGIVRVHKITIYHIPHLGFLLYGSALVLAFTAAWRRETVLRGS